ncbi:MAG TPA: matrixin family metalloprotease [Blastocatellia bacterium]|nr:matrixin family metalloprotease [Blastocatellia bacterium]
MNRTALATTVIIPSDADMVIGARAIVTGKVLEVSTAWDASSDVVFTYIRLTIHDILKGELPEREIILKQPGGETYHRGTSIHGMPRFEVGEKVFLYLDTWADGSLRVHQWFLGKFNITRDMASGQEVVRRDDPGPNVHVLASADAQSASGSDLQSYKKMVSNLVAANTMAAQEFERRHYRNVPMQARPPEFEQMRRGGQVIPFYSYSNPSQPIRWFEPDNGASVVFYLNMQKAPYPEIGDDIAAAMRTWATATGGKLRVINGGSTGGCGINKTDGQNTISFTNCDGYFSASSGCSGILAVGGIISYQPDETKVINGVRFAKGLEGNVSFNPYASCHFSNRCNVQEIAVHELGHALGLGHSVDTTATMYQYLRKDGRCASVGEDDINGIAFIYPGGSGGPVNISTKTLLPLGTLNQPYAAILEASGGKGSHTWSVVEGQLPPGLQLSISGFLQGVPAASNSFTFTAQVKDSSGNRSQRTFSMDVQDPSLGPFITGVEVKKQKKITIRGLNMDPRANVYIDGQQVTATVSGSALKVKKKLEPGTHTVQIINPDGRLSNVMAFPVS